MELMLQWFWLIKLAVGVLFLYTLYRAWKTAEETKKIWNKWTTISLIILILQIINPIKMDINTKGTTDRANVSIEKSKVLPEMTPSSRKDISTSGISGEDLK